MQIPSLFRLLWLSHCTALVAASDFALVERASASAVPTPVSVAPSQNWYLHALPRLSRCADLT